MTLLVEIIFKWLLLHFSFSFLYFQKTAATAAIPAESVGLQIGKTTATTFTLSTINTMLFGKAYSIQTMEKYDIICRAAALIFVNFFHYFL